MSKTSDQIDHNRRHFFGAAALTFAAAQLGLLGPTMAATLPTVKPGANTSFGPLKQINAGTLSVGYAEAGPANGAPIILLHGWPYDIHSFVDVAPTLAAAGYRVIVPYVRGYGTTRFLASDTPRSGQPLVVAIDLVALMDALKIDKAILAGFDWGARSANIVAALWRPRERRQGRRHRHAQERSDRHEPDRSGAAGARLCSRRCSRCDRR